MRELLAKCDAAQWISAKLGEVATCTLGGTPSTEVPRFWGGSVPWMASGDVHLRRIHDVPGRITAVGLAGSNATLVPPPAVAVGLAGQGKTRGTVALTLCELSTNQSIALLRGDETRLQTAYLFHNLDRRYEELRARSSGGGRGGLSKGILDAVPIDLPPVGEQAKIAEVLDTLDTTIRQAEAIIEKLKQVKQGLLHDLLTRGIDANGELRPPQSQAPHLYKDSPLGWIPSEWEARTVGDSCELHNGLRLPLASDVREKMEGPYPYFGPTGILDFINEFRVEGTFVLIGEDGDHFLKFGSRPMTQLVSGRFNVNNHAHLLTGRLCRTEWVDAWFRHRDITLFLTRQGAGRFKLNKASLQSLPIGTPTDNEQRVVLSALVSMEARISLETRVLEKLAAQKSGLMDDLLTGRVRVTPLLA